VKQTYRLMIATFTLCLIAMTNAFGQADTLSGKYEGVAKLSGSPDAAITLELKNEGGKITGQLVHGQTTIPVSEGNLSSNKLSLKLGEAAKDGVLTANVDGDKLSGDWVAGTQKKTVELKKSAASTAAANTSVDLNGQWDGVSDVQGQPFPFLLTLKIEGEKVTGGSSSQLGDTSISAGTWKDGKLSFQLQSNDGVITMNATVIDGKLSGEFDFAGQLQGKWVAVKKN
jgi:hypothetical protein